MKEFVLKTAQNGFAAGPVFDADRSQDKTTEKSQTYCSYRELTHYRAAVSQLDRELASAAAKTGQNSTDIYETQRLLLKDTVFTETIPNLIQENSLDAMTAVEKAGRILTVSLANINNAYIRQRADDASGITERLLSILRGTEPDSPNIPSIIVSKELSPARLAAIDPALILGIITEKGSPTSHVSILAGNLDIPCLIGSKEAVAAARTSSKVIIENGNLITDPNEDVYQEALCRLKEKEKSKKKQIDSSQRDRPQTDVYANISFMWEIPDLINSGAQGIGLLRPEFLFSNHSEPPSEEEQFEAYKMVVEAMDGKETVIRTMDSGSDKKPNWLCIPNEKNPALGCRGLRFSLKRPSLFRAQLRALLRAAVFGNLKILLPMVTSVREVETVRTLLAECAKELSKEGIEYAIPPLGIMIETPAAALIADELAQAADFFSIGTNDLTQYTLALDREAQELDELYEPFHEAIFRLIAMASAAGYKYNIPVSVCGELAGNPNAIKRLIEYGVNKLSVSLSKVQETKLRVIAAEAELHPHQENWIAAPADGKLIPMEDIPDPVFSAGTLGDCIGILPDNGTIYAPCDGIVSSIAHTGHALSISAADGREILVHAGIDTATLGGKGFTIYVQEGSKVSTGDIMMEADLSVIREAGLSPIVITACVKRELNE